MHEWDEHYIVLSLFMVLAFLVGEPLVVEEEVVNVREVVGEYAEIWVGLVGCGGTEHGDLEEGVECPRDLGTE